MASVSEVVVHSSQPELKGLAKSRGRPIAELEFESVQGRPFAQDQDCLDDFLRPSASKDMKLRHFAQRP